MDSKVMGDIKEGLIILNFAGSTFGFGFKTASKISVAFFQKKWHKILP